MARYRELFIDPPFAVESLPSYDIATASNPFVTYRAIPSSSRYEFLLDEAQFFIMNFIKGPVCRGQLALDVIEDHFWAFFIEPDSSFDEAVDEELSRSAGNLQLPAEWGSDAPIIKSSREYAKLEVSHLAVKQKWLDENIAEHGGLDLSLIWDGEGSNPNAALTIFRHFDSATVEKGLIGPVPKTAWIVSYPLLERIFYLLVAGYDVYGNAGHQINSRLYMDFLRMEGESNFLIFLPEKARKPTRDYWYRGTSDEIKSLVYGGQFKVELESSIAYRTDDPRSELIELLQARVGPAVDSRFDLSKVSNSELRGEVAKLGQLQGASLQWLPETTLLRIEDEGTEAQYFTMLRNVGHGNVSNVLRESKFLLPDEDTLTVVPGFIGAYPNSIYRLSRAELPALSLAIARLSSDQDYSELADRFAVRRSDPGFWAASDAAIDAYARWAPAEAGLFDYSRLENR
jgi:hypothetical protein